MKPPAHIIKALFLAMLIAIPLAAITKGFDNFTTEAIDGSFTATTAIYATARGINALVSLLQGTEVDLPFVTVAIGELLDPVNDLIERFASIVLFALSAIAAQKILLMMVASNIFNYVLCGVAFLTAIALFTRRSSLFSPIFKCFVVIVFIRFSLGIVVIANYWVDHVFLAPNDQTRHQSMEVFEDELKTIKDLTTNSPNYQEEQTYLQASIDQLNKDRNTAQTELDNKSEELKKLNTQFEKLPFSKTLTCWDSLPSLCDESIRPEIDRLQEAQKEVQIAKEKFESIIDKLGQHQEALACSIKRSIGETCSVWDHLPDAPDLESIQVKIESMESKVSAFTENAWLLVTSLLLKSVLIPIVFLYLLINLTKQIWKLEIQEDIL